MNQIVTILSKLFYQKRVDAVSIPIKDQHNSVQLGGLSTSAAYNAVASTASTKRAVFSEE